MGCEVIAGGELLPRFMTEVSIQLLRRLENCTKGVYTFLTVARMAYEAKPDILLLYQMTYHSGLLLQVIPAQASAFRQLQLDGQTVSIMP